MAKALKSHITLINHTITHAAFQSFSQKLQFKNFIHIDLAQYYTYMSELFTIKVTQRFQYQLNRGPGDMAGV